MQSQDSRSQHVSGGRCIRVLELFSPKLDQQNGWSTGSPGRERKPEIENTQPSAIHQWEGAIEGTLRLGGFTSLVQRLLDVCDHRLEQIRALQDESQRLEEEIAVLKGRDEVRPRTVRGLKDLS